ncbi:PREDICTED: uncharacterized protein LOC104802586 [Tarenaya hassleriana]|uniref:uncharacterized protein LOC104802586 n=1 Tax=Tarenaya hassleriana TaxID=28532 RepID=UPI00053C698E|nr:PREDICTED: uncharacterized protein LOC104802586 [Tarenaya hassleriana]
MAMAQIDRHMRIAEEAFAMVDKFYGKTPRTNPKPNPNPIRDRFNKPIERAINCDDAFRRFGGVLIKEFRN